MGKRDQIIEELDKGLAHLADQEQVCTSRSTGLLAVSTAAVAVVISLRQRGIDPPVILIVLYGLLAVVSCVGIAGRSLVNPSVNLDLHGQWADLAEDDVYQVLSDVKRLALRVNSERMIFVRAAFRAHLCLVAATLVVSLVLLWSYA